MTKVELKGLEKVLKKLEFLPVLAQGVEAAGLWVKGYMADYPHVRRGPQPFKTMKQQKYFFWALEHGVIDVPYRRGMSPKSESLADAWTVVMRKGGREAVVGNDTSYGPWVQDEDKPQSYYHKMTGWETTQEVTRTKGEKVKNVILEEVQKHLKS